MALLLLLSLPTHTHGCLLADSPVVRLRVQPKGRSRCVFSFLSRKAVSCCCHVFRLLPLTSLPPPRLQEARSRLQQTDARRRVSEREAVVSPASGARGAGKQRQEGRRDTGREIRDQQKPLGTRQRGRVRERERETEEGSGNQRCIWIAFPPFQGLASNES